jgi:hypothetical protein
MPFVSKNVVSIEISNHVYSGGAHGLPSSFSASYDRHTGKYISWENMFGQNNKFDTYVYERVKNELAGKSYVDFFHVDRALYGFKEKGHFLITKRGLEITFDPYEIASYAEGFRELTIPHKVLKQYMAKERYTYYFEGSGNIYVEKDCPTEIEERSHNVRQK